MFTLNEIKNELFNKYNQNVDIDILEKYIHIWNIEPINTGEDEDFIYDEKTVYNLHRGIKLTSNGFNETVVPDILKFKTKKQQSETNNTIESSDILTDPDANIFEKIKKPKDNKILNQTNPAKPERAVNISKKVTEITNAKSFSKTEPKEECVKKVTSEKKPNAITILSEKIAEKVSLDIFNYLQKDSFIDKITTIGTLKRDNEILSKQVQELLKANSDLEDKYFELELEKRSFKQLWKNFYIKLN